MAAVDIKAKIKEKITDNPEYVVAIILTAIFLPIATSIANISTLLVGVAVISSTRIAVRSTKWIVDRIEDVEIGHCYSLSKGTSPRKCKEIAATLEPIRNMEIEGDNTGMKDFVLKQVTKLANGKSLPLHIIGKMDLKLRELTDLQETAHKKQHHPRIPPTESELLILIRSIDKFQKTAGFVPQKFNDSTGVSVQATYATLAVTFLLPMSAAIGGLRAKYGPAIPDKKPEIEHVQKHSAALPPSAINHRADWAARVSNPAIASKEASRSAG